MVVKKSKVRERFFLLVRANKFPTVEDKMMYARWEISQRCELIDYVEVDTPAGRMGMLVYAVELVYKFDDRYEIDYRYMNWLNDAPGGGGVIGKHPE